MFFMGSRATVFTFENRQYRVERAVFDPVRHISGVVFAEHLAHQKWPNRRVLELGTGCGLLAGVLHDHGATVTAVDISDASVTCAEKNLSDTSVEILQSDLFASIPSQRFDLIIMNPPYEVGRAFSRSVRSPDVLARLAEQWESFADELILAFPTDSVDVLEAAGLDLELVKRIRTDGRELGIFANRNTRQDVPTS
jgi:16S rRNA G966 N2-methylase RsmD